MEHDHGSELTDTQRRVRALESMLVEKGYVDPAALDALIDTYETKVGPRNGARVVAKAWVDPGVPRLAARRRRGGDRLARLHRPPGRAHGGGREHAGRAQHGRLHAVLLLPVAGARAAAGLVQVARPIASRAVIDPRGVLREFGVELPDDDRDPGVGLDRRAPLPRGADAAGRHRGLDEDELADAGHPRLDDRHRPARAAVNGAHDLGGMHGFGPVVPEPDEPAFHADWERRAFALTLAMGATGEWNLDMSRFARESHAAGRVPREHATTRSGWPGWSGCSSSTVS